MQVIWRIEDTSGLGPYHSPKQGEKWCADLLQSFQHPAPGVDGLPIYELGREFFFGFSSYELLCAWFLLDDLHLIEECVKAGEKPFYITLWLVEERYVKRGGKQLTFVREKAHLLAKGRMQSLIKHLKKVGNDGNQA